MTIRLADKNDSTSIINLFKDVFLEDPLMKWFLKNDDKEKASNVFYRFMINKYCMPHNLCWITEDKTGAACWIPPGKWDIPPVKQLLLIGVIVRSFGFKTLSYKMNERMKIDSDHPKKPHYYLAGIGVRNDLRGVGIGSSLLQPILERSDNEKTGCYLETSLERNLTFYTRLGFDITKKLSIGPEKIPVWLMWRNPR